MFVPIQMGTNMTPETNRNRNKGVNLSLEEPKNIKIIIFFNTRTVQIAKFPEISPEISHFLTNTAVM